MRDALFARGLRTMMRTLCVTAAASVVLLPYPAQAFESYEHREMSSLAAEIAIRYTERKEGAAQPNDPVSPGLSALRQMARHYGIVTQCVDYFMSPERLLAYAGKHRANERSTARVRAGEAISASGASSMSPSSAQQLINAAGERAAESTTRILNSGGGIPTEPVESALADLPAECSRSGIRYLQATHSNHAHFQENLLMSMRLWHLTAVALATQESNYHGALLTNAIADHYLQDFFAPGHIVTPRDRLSDLQATAGHDLGNAMGALFWPTLTPRLRQVLDFLCPEPGAGDCAENPMLDMALRHPERHIRIDQLPRSAATLRAGRSVLLRGDGRLDGPEQAPQRLLMLLAQVSSILDVVEGKNHLRRAEFDYALGRGEPFARVDFGQYEFQAHGTAYASRVDVAPTQPLPDRLTADDERSEGSTSTHCIVRGCDDRTYPLRSRAPVLSFSVERTSFSPGMHHSRNLQALELSTAGRIVDVSRFSGRWLSGIELVPTFGLATIRDGARHGWGPTARLAVAVPETEGSVGVYARWLEYKSNSGSDARRLSYGLRIEGGFSSYLTFYFTGGMDYSRNFDGALVRGRMWGGGIRFGVPTTRVGWAFGGDDKPAPK